VTSNSVSMDLGPRAAWMDSSSHSLTSLSLHPKRLAVRGPGGRSRPCPLPLPEQASAELANEMVADQPGKLGIDHKLWVVERGTELAPSLGGDVTQTAVEAPDPRRAGRRRIRELDARNLQIPRNPDRHVLPRP
jgi:hypothetical protein